MGVSHRAVVQLQVGAVGALEDAMAEAIHILLLFLLGVSRQHLLGETYKPALLCGRAWGWTDRGGSSISGLTAHWCILKCRGLCEENKSVQQTVC